MKIVFMGTPAFSLESLESLIGAGHEVAAVFTQPDKPRNRGKQMTMTPIKECAMKHDIPVYQPLSLRKGEDAERSLAALKDIAPDCIVVVAYGQLLPKEVLELPKYGCVNVHASLLPKYRGAAPIQRCIQCGETVSGVTTMYMAEGLDTGDIIKTMGVEITPDMTGSRLSELLSVAGAELIVETLAAIEKGEAKRTPQSGETCYASIITKEELKIDFTQPAKRVYDFIRAMADIPCAYVIMDGKRFKIFRAQISNEETDAEPGTIINAERFGVACGDGGTVELIEIQPEGGKRMELNAYLRGKKLQKGAVLNR